MKLRDVFNSSYPLLQAMSSELSNTDNCTATQKPTTQVPNTQGPITQGPTTKEPLTPAPPVSTPSTTEGECTDDEAFISVCYYSNWAYWRAGNFYFNTFSQTLFLFFNLSLLINGACMQTHD